MRILLTNITLASQTGTEIVTRDLALGLKAKGHSPIVFTPNPGIVAEQIERGGVSVVRSLEDVQDIPDIIHGHHLVETASALFRFPRTPAIFVCHDRLIWHDFPPIFGQVRRFVAVDRNCLERLHFEAGIPEDKTRLIFNAVDTTRFLPRTPLPQRPERALIFSNNARPGTHLEPIRQACQQNGVVLDVVGTGMGSSSTEPERILANYDLVFAKARCALEAMAVGCAVVLCDTRGLGGLVQKNNVAGLREWNFGMRCLDRPATPGRIIREMLAYDAADAAAVSAYIRDDASLDRALDSYISLYEEVIAEKPVSSAPIVPTDVIRVLARRAGELEDRLRADGRLFMPPLPRHIGERLSIHVSSSLNKIQPGSWATVRIRIRNGSEELLASIGRHPVHCSYHWLNALTRETVVFEGERTALAADITPGAEGEQELKVAAPATEGDFILQVTLVQEGVFWFDGLDAPVADEIFVTVASQPRHSPPSPISLQQAASWTTLRMVRDGAFSNLSFVDGSLPECLAFVESESFVKQASENANLSCVITLPEFAAAFPNRLGVAVCGSPRRAFADVHNYLASSTSFYWTDFASVIHPSARIHPKSFVAEQNVIIGANVVVHANATILERTFIEDGVTIYPGAVLGSIGFQTIRAGDEVLDLAHAGGIRVCADVQILANAIIARAVFRQFTEIGRNARIGNAAFLSHNTSVGSNSFVGHGAVINGSVKIGANAWIGPGATLVHGIEIGERAHVGFGSAVMRDVDPGARVLGSIALPQRKMLRMMASRDR